MNQSFLADLGHLQGRFLQKAGIKESLPVKDKKAYRSLPYK